MIFNGVGYTYGKALSRKCLKSRALIPHHFCHRTEVRNG